MGSQPFERWSNFEVVSKEEDFDVFSFPSQRLPLDFSGCSAYAASDFHYDMPIQETAFDSVPLLHDPFYSLQDFQQSQNVVQGDLWSGLGNGFRGWNNEMNLEFDIGANQPLSFCDCSEGIITSEEFPVEEKKKIRRQREEKGSCSKTLSRQTISKYFYMPITQAAKELNVGLTLLKKRCRELGIRRWPHRKLMSLQTLINNVQEMRNAGGGHIAEKKLREAIELLEHEKKLMEEIPDMQLEDQTKRLRQACFKANYKKRKLMGMMESQSSFQSNFKGSFGSREEDDDYEEDLKSIVADCLSSSNTVIFHS